MREMQSLSMKKIKLTAVIAMLLCGLFIVAAVAGETNKKKDANIPPVVVMLGDSTTDRGMPTFVKKQLDKLITSDLHRPKVINAGKGGDNATSALDRLQKDVLAHNPDIVTVSFGLNDTGGRKPEKFKESLKQIVKTLKDADIEVILMTSTPFNNDRHGWSKQFQDLGGLDEYMDREFCQKMRSLADGNEVLLCDLHTIFKNKFKQDSDLINKVISTDGVHLTAEGYILVAEHVAPVIHKLLTGSKKDNNTAAGEGVKMYTNPIIPGDWSDPGVVRVGQDYYSVRSSFGWQPGLHIAHSKDLIHWKYIGFADTENAFDRPHGITERGIWGSDIGYNPNNKTFLVYAPMGGNIRVFSSSDPAGPYKDGGRLTNGYDPGFFADDDGALYLTKSGGEIYKLTSDGLRIDGDPITKVAGGEGPEIFKANGYYYYIISPGGTRPYQDHKIMSYRAKSLKGPWQADPKNPMMYAPHTTNAKLQGPGHGEVFQTQNGQWYLTYHAYELSHYSLGRQTCMEPVTWTDDGWWRPVNGPIPSQQNKAPSLKQVAYKMQDSDEFDSAVLSKQWFFHTEPDYSGSCWSLTERPGYLRIKTGEGDISSPSVAKNLFLQRVIHKKFDIVTEVTFDAQQGNEAAGIHLYHDPDKSIWLTTTVVDGQKMFEVGYRDKPFKSDVDPAQLKPHEINKTYRTTPKIKNILARVNNTIGSTVFLKMSIDGHEHVRFFYSADGKSWTAIGSKVNVGDSWHCSLLGKKPGSPDLGWVGCGRDNVWTGTVMGVFACKNSAAKSKNADFQSFHITKH